MKKFSALLFLFAMNACLLYSQVSELEGLWIGYELGRPGTWTFRVNGDHCEVYGADSVEWYKGTFKLDTTTDPKRFDMVIDDCALPLFIGVKGLAIYKIEGDTLVYAGEQPGSGSYPINFSRGDPDGNGYNTRVFKGGKQNETGVMNHNPEENEFIIYPNPFSKSTRISFVYPGIIKIIIYNQLGKVIWFKEFINDLDEVKNVIFDAGSHPVGLYYCTIRSNNGLHTKKMLLIY